MKQPLMWLLFISLLLLCSCHSDTFEVRGVTEGIAEGDTLYVTTDMMYGIPTDTLLVHEGKFSFSGQVDSVYQCVVYNATTGGNALLFIEPGVINVRIVGMTDGSRVWGTKLNDEWQSITDSMTVYSNRVNQLLRLKCAGADSIPEEVGVELMRLTDGMRQCIYHSAERNINNELGYFLILMGDLSDEERLSLINRLPKQMRSREAISEVMNSLWEEDSPGYDIDEE